MGVKTAMARCCRHRDDSAALYLPAGARGPAFLVFANFSVILKYNNAASYALAVGLLADRMAGGAPLQSCLAARRTARCRAPNAFSSRPILTNWDLIPATPMACWAAKAARRCRQYQKSKGIAADGFPTAALLAMLNKDAANALSG